MSHTSMNHNRLVGSLNPCNAGGLVWRLRHLLFIYSLWGGDVMSGLKGNVDSFVGIDVSKDKFDVCGITGEEAKLFQFSTTMDRKGFEKLKGHLGTISVSSVLIGMESTASYHVCLLYTSPSPRD